MKTAILSILAAALSLSGCGNSMSTQNPSGNQAPATTWIWIGSEGGFRGGIVTPKTAGYTQHYVFRVDSTFSFARTPDTTNASWSGSYQVSRSYYPITRDTQFMIRFYLPHGPEPEGIVQRLQYRGSDTILIGEDAADGIIETYAQVK